MTVVGSFNFDSPQHYTAVIITSGQMKNSMVNDGKSQLDVQTELEGERVRECQP